MSNSLGRSRSLGRVLAVLLAAALIPIVPFAVIGELPTDRWLTLAGVDRLRFGLSGAALLALDVFLPVPSSLVGALLGGRLGFAAGFGWAWLGLGAGHIAGYGLGRLAPARWASELPAAPSIAVVFLSRPVPVLAEAVAIAAGVERMPIARYLGAALLGDGLYAAAMAADGAALLPAGFAGPGLLAPMLVPVLAYGIWRALERRRST